MEPTEFDVVVIGGGPAGMLAAILAAESGRTVHIVEKNEILGKKLRATGGQFSNRKIGPERYHDDGELAWAICRTFPPDKVDEFFRSIGVEFIERPVSERSTLLIEDPDVVTDALEMYVAELKVTVTLHAEVVSVRTPDDESGAFSIETDGGEVFSGRQVVVAIGGKAYPQLGADQTELRFVREMGHAVVPQYAASTRGRPEIVRIPNEEPDWDVVVVCGGGVSVGEIDPATMESRLIPGLYFAGEGIDIQGDRGGYNLQFAFASGYLAGQGLHVDPPYPHLLSPIRIGSLRLKNRIVMPAMATGFDVASERGRKHFGLRAKEGVGLIICGQVSIGALSAEADLEAYRELVREVHAGGAKLGIQLHASKRDVPAMLDGAPDSFDPVNDLPVDMMPVLAARFVDAATCARDVGFDLVEIHCAHSSLLSRFASPRSNHRTDSYGGGRENRNRLPLEVATAVSDALGAPVPVAFRINAEEIAEGGATMDDAIALARGLAERGVAVIDVAKCGPNASKSGEGIICPPPDAQEGTHFEAASRIREAAGVPVIGVGRVQDPKFADDAVADGVVDLVAVGRGLFADPSWARRAYAGTPEEIVSCLACNTCMDELFAGNGISCPQNPGLGAGA